MPDFAKLSQLQWRIICETLGDDYSPPWGESRRVARVRAISRLVARGIIERKPGRKWVPFVRIDWKADVQMQGHWAEEIALIAPLGAVKRAAKDAWLRDQEDGKSFLDSASWTVLRQIEHNARVRLSHKGGWARHHRFDRPAGPTVLQLSAVASCIKLLTGKGEPVEVGAMARLLSGVPGFSEDVVGRALAELKARGHA
jgi:hypothetical protein